MNKSPEKNQIFFELAMAIGGSLHLYEMLRTALHSYLQQLDCVAGIVYKVEHEGLSRISSEMIFSIPYTLAVRKRYKELENLIPTFHSKANFEEYQSSLPLKSRNKTEVFFHIMNLEEFGFLVLVKQDCYLEDDILIRLQEVNQKLAHTCNACVKHDKVEESEKRYHDLSLLLPEMVCETNREGIVTFANKFAVEKLGYSMRDMKKGFAIANIFPPTEHERFLKNFKHALINDNLPPRQYKAIKKDGTTFPVLVYTSRLIKNRKIEGLRGVMVDITERKEYENKVRQYTERLELALLGSNAGLWDWNILTGEVYFSERWCSMLGYELSEVEPNVSSWERLVHPDDLPHVMEVLNKHLENGVALYQSEHRVKTKSGEWKWILDTGKVIQRDDSGKAIRAVGTHIDISERNRNEELANIERDLGIKLGKSKNLQQTLNICLESSIKYSQMDCGGIYMANESDGSYNLVQQIGLSDDFIKNASYYTADSPNAKTISEGKPIYTKHKKTIRKGDALKGEVFNALAVIPILYLNKPVGCLNIASRSMMSIPDYSRIILERISQYIGSFIIQARQEDRLRQNQQDLNTLFNTIDDFLFILDTEGRMIYFNSTVTERLGYSEKELINEHVLKVHPPARHDEATLRIQGMLMGTETVCGVPLLCKDNTEIPVETKVKKGTWSGKEVIIGICRNTAERKGYEKQIKENTERLEMALLASEAGLWDWNIKTNELILNEKWFAMRSFDNSQAKYSIDSWKELLHPQDLDSTISALNNHLKNKTPFYQAEYRTKTKLGNYIWVLDTGKIMEYDALGEPLRVVGTNIDITSKKENELNLQQNLKQQELLSEISLELNSLDKFDNRINAILKKIGIHTDVSRVYIFEDFNDGFATCNTFEWCNCNIIPQIEELQEVPYEIIPSWKKLFFEKGRVYSENISELPEDLRTILEPQEIKSIVVYPLYVQGAYFGFIGFDECIRYKVWSKSELELLRTFSGIIANAYERKLSEKSLQESEEKYRILIENQAEGISIIDINETFLFANPAAEKIFGVELGGLKNKSLSQFTTAKEFEKVRTETQKRITGVRATYELEIICPSGDLKTLLLSTSPYLDSNGIFIGGFGIFRDITELKKTENALKESEEKYSNIVNNANDGIYLRDLNGTIIFANRKFAEIHEYPLDEIIGRKSWEFLHPDSLKKITESRELDRVQSGYQTQGEEVGLTKSGKSVYLDIRTGPLMNHGEITGIFGIIRNISERKEYERQLTEERDRANQANTAKSEFLANMSHEIRTPMNAILGFSEALYHKLESQQHKKILKSVLSSGNLLLSLLNDILDLSKIEAGKLEIVPQPIDFSSLLQEIVLLFKDKAHAKGVELNTLIAPDFPRVILLDEIRIKQVVFNLVGNALKFTHHGYVNIHASFTKTNESIGEMQFEVEDSGIGIPETQQELIFESFRQQSGQSNRQYGGIGLGLAISKRLVEKMNGTISVSSIEGKGSTFKVFFPAVEISNRGAKRKDVYDEVPNITFDPVSILVIDDVASNIETIESLLSNSGLTISSAENGEMALEILNHSIPELIILDIRMPGMDGYEVAKHIRKNKKTKHVPVIAYTASVFGTEKNIEFSNFDGVIFKPVNRFELYEQLKRFLKYSDGIQAVKNEKPTIESYIISNPEIVCRFPEIKKILEEKHLPKWERIKDSLVLFSIEAFSKELKETAQEFNFQFLSDYCQRINEDVDMVDLESLKETLYEFPSIIEHISQVIKS